ncbi:MAG: hypothetical protein JO117_11655 [Verrucomicrobia bacterium]|nr:hypothetical protein [Verrucomicrobiota bacterium]
MGEFLECIFTGKIGASELLQGAKEIWEIEKREARTPSRFIDLSGVEAFDLSFASISDFANVRRQSDFKNPIRSAIYASRGIAFGFARMYQSLNENPKLTIRVFREREAALRWMRGEDSPANPLAEH